MPKKFPPEFKRDVVRVARRGDLSQAEAGRPKGSSGGGQLPYDSADVRHWATENGLEVNPRGRISQEVVDKYYAALGQPNP